MSDVRVVYITDPLSMRSEERRVPAGQTLAQIVEGLGIRPAFARDVTVQVSLGDSVHIVPEPLRRAVRPKAGALVNVCAARGRNELAMVAAVGLAIAAPYAGAALYGSAGLLGTSALGASLVTATVTVAGSLAINKLLAPPQPRLGGSAQAAPTFQIGGSGNRIAPYGRVPLVIGRHRMFPDKTALPYTETGGIDTYLHERMTFGYAPVALETLKIGDTPIHLVATTLPNGQPDLQIEFRNVDQARTMAMYPEIAPFVVGWRTGTDYMRLFPDDIREERFSIRLRNGEAGTVRRTASDAISAEVEITLPQGLGFLNANGSVGTWGVFILVQFRAVGASTWQTGEVVEVQRADRTPWRAVSRLTFPAPGDYEILTQRISDDVEDIAGEPEGRRFGDSFLTAIRTVQVDGIPGAAEIAEVAIRVRGNEKLNGNLDQLNSIVHRLVPFWTGSGWSAPTQTRHPAWHYADLLRGGMRQDPVPQSQIDVAALVQWTEQEPFWTCDYVVDGDLSTGAVADIICAAGRAKWTSPDGVYSIARDRADGPIKQVFSPRNSWGFGCSGALPKPIDGFLVQAVSEDADWQTVEVPVYADGVTEANAARMEPLELPGTILTAGQTTGGLVWRLGRYHWAQAKLRPETFEISVSLEHLVTTKGDKVRIVQDEASIGVGQGRIKDITTSGANLTSLRLDDVQDVAAGTYRLIIRRADGVMVTATATGGELSPSWAISGTVPAAGIASSDLVLIEDTGIESYDAVITEIISLDDLSATLKLMPAAPDVLRADQGVIPSFNPLISRSDRADVPPIPTVMDVFTGPSVALRTPGGADQPRVAVLLSSARGSAVARFRLRYRQAGQEGWLYSDMWQDGLLITPPLREGVPYDVSVTSEATDGRSRGWTEPRTVIPTINGPVPAATTGLRVTVSGDQMRLTWDDASVDYWSVRHSSDPAATWGETVVMADRLRVSEVVLPAINGVLHVRATGYSGLTATTSATVQVQSAGLSRNAVSARSYAPDWTGSATGAVVATGATLVAAAGSNNLLAIANLLPVADIFTEGLTGSGLSYYTLTDTINLGGTYTARVSASVRAGGAYPSFDILAVDDLLAIPDMFGASDLTWSVTTQIQLDGGPWRDFVIGDYTFQVARFRLAIEVNDTQAIVTVTQFDVAVDMGDRIARGHDVAHTSGGTTITYSPAFKDVPALVIDGQSLPTGARIIRSAESRAGFTVNFTDSSGVNLSGVTFDYSAVGYGQEV